MSDINIAAASSPAASTISSKGPHTLTLYPDLATATTAAPTEPAS
ncbi:hypothetical protein [Nocardia transvalensis]|nr:hypothetical protein [Nocardia transvalensis]